MQDNRVSQKIHIDSDLLTYGTKTNFEVTVFPAIQAKDIQYRIHSLSIPHSYLNMWPQSTGLFLSYSTALDGANTDAISNQQYTLQGLFDALEEKINTFASGTFEFEVFNGIIRLNQKTGPANAITITLANVQQSYSVWPFLGFTTAQTSTSLTANNTYNISGPGMLYIHSSKLTGRADYVDGANPNGLDTGTAIGSVPVNGDSGESIVYFYPAHWSRSLSETINRIDISLRYADGTLVDLLGLGMTMTIDVEYTLDPRNV